MRSCWIRAGLKSDDGCPYMEGALKTQRKYREEGPVSTEAKTGAILSQAKDSQQRSGLEKPTEVPSLEASAGARPCRHLEFGLLASRTSQAIPWACTYLAHLLVSTL